MFITACVLLLLLSVSPEKVEMAMDHIEKYVMTRLYKYVFCPETTEDEKKDLAIQKRIRYTFWSWPLFGVH